MQSYIIYGADQDKRLLKAAEICKKNGIDQFDTSFISSNDETEKSSSIGILTIKLFQQKIFLKPLRGKSKAAIITEAEKLTIPAQNALLKLLEEPPENTLIFLITNKNSVLLPTIRSRCKEIELETERNLSDKDLETIYIEWKEIIKAPVPHKLTKAQDFAKEKEAGIQKLEAILYSLSDRLLQKIKAGESTLGIKYQIDHIQEAHKLLTTTNANPRLIFEHLFLSCLDE